MRRFLLVGLLATVFYLPTIRSRNLQDCGASSRLATAQSLVERGTFVIDQSTFAYTCDRMVVDGHFYSDKPPVLSLIAATVYYVLHRGFGRQFDETAHPLTNPVGDSTYGLMIALIVVVAQGLLVASFDRAAGQLGLKGVKRVVADLTIAVGTILWPLTALFNSHTVAAAVVFIGLTAIFIDRRPVRAGIMLGLAATIDIPLGSLALAAGLLLGSQRRRVLAGALAPLVVHTIVSYWIVGDVIPFQMHRELYTVATGHTGTSATGFTQDAGLLVYAVRNLFGSLGVFSLTPVLLLAVLLAAREGLRPDVAAHEVELRQLAVAAVGLFGAALVLYVVVWPEAVGCAYGMRHVTPAVAPLLLVAAVAASRAKQTWIAFVTLGLISTVFAGGGILGPATCGGFVDDSRALIPAYVFFDNISSLLLR